MLNPATNLLPPSPSPTTTTSVSSSDVDTASTGSFFQDRSTTLGTLMGLTLPPSFSLQHLPMATDREGDRRRRMRGWRWGLCRGRRSSASLAEYFEMERRFGEALCGGLVSAGGGERLSFSDGRVLPPDGISTAALRTGRDLLPWSYGSIG